MKLWYFSLGRKKAEGLMLFTFGLLLLGAGIFFNDYNSSVLPATTKTVEPVYEGSPDYHAMALTVNVAWGAEYLPQILQTLAEKGVPATFYIEGRFAEKYPEVVKTIALGGHEIGSHGYSHPHVDELSQEQNMAEIKKAEEVLVELTGTKPVLFAPPYGERKDQVLAAAAACGYLTILWTLDTIDWQQPAASTIVERITSRAANGAIVLMHPTAPTVSALPVIIDELLKEDYQLLTVSQLLQQGNNKEQENHNKEQENHNKQQNSNNKGQESHNQPQESAEQS